MTCKHGNHSMHCGWCEDQARITELEAHAQGLRERIAELEASDALQPCGHPKSLVLHSAESGEPLYCEACDDKSGRRDAELRESELAAANAAQQKRIAELEHEAQFYKRRCDAMQEWQSRMRDPERTAQFYKRRCDAMQEWQSRMRDPERAVVCDILANGFTLDPSTGRYAVLEAQRVPLTDEQIADAVREADLDWHHGWTLDETEANRFTQLVRAVERAHGIEEVKR